MSTSDIQIIITPDARQETLEFLKWTQNQGEDDGVEG